MNEPRPRSRLPTRYPRRMAVSAEGSSHRLSCLQSHLHPVSLNGADMMHSTAATSDDSQVGIANSDSSETGTCMHLTLGVD